MSAADDILAELALKGIAAADDAAMQERIAALEARVAELANAVSALAESLKSAREVKIGGRSVTVTVVGRDEQERISSAEIKVR